MGELPELLQINLQSLDRADRDAIQLKDQLADPPGEGELPRDPACKHTDRGREPGQDAPQGAAEPSSCSSRAGSPISTLT